MKTESAVDLLRLLVPTDPASSESNWVGLNAQGAVVATGHHHLAELPRHKKLQLILPASQVAAHIVQAPAGAGRHLPALVQQALEDSLLGNKDSAHTVIGPYTPAGHKVWVCNLPWLRSVMAALDTAGLRPDEAFAEYDLLPEEDFVICAATDSAFLFRTPQGKLGYVDDYSSIQVLLGDEFITEVENLFQRPLAPNACNLLTGALQPRHTVDLRIGMFARSAQLTLAIAFTVLISVLIYWQQLERREKTLKDEIRQTFATAFPGTPILADPYQQWESRRRDSGSSDGYTRDALDLIAGFANSLPNPIRPSSIEFRDGVIRVLLTESDAAQIRDQLKQSGKDHEFIPADAGFTRLEVRNANKR